MVGCTCRGKCDLIKRCSRKAKGSKVCHPCDYVTKSKDVRCPCCSKKYKIRKAGKRRTDFVRIGYD